MGEILSLSAYMIFSSSKMLFKHISRWVNEIEVYCVINIARQGIFQLMYEVVKQSKVYQSKLLLHKCPETLNQTIVFSL